jgi:hypothetical protein
MILKFICEDNYEAEKLSSIFTLQKDGSLYVIEIVKVIENEVIIKLKDGSHHSIILKDPENALRLKKIISHILSTQNRVISTSYIGNEMFMDLK